MTQHEQVNVFRSLAGLECSTETSDKQSYLLRFSVCKVCQAWYVTLGLNHQETQVGPGLSFGNGSVANIDQLILVDCAARNRDFTSVLATHKAVCWMRFEYQRISSM
jgi:hypothetical protein